MQPTHRKKLYEIRSEVENNLVNGIMPFWTEHGIDPKYGGYLTCFDALGRLDETDSDKYIVTQTRMIWGFSLFHRMFPNAPRYLQAARQGVDFFLRYFWDEQVGGWRWKVRRDGAPLDAGKLVYGQSFAIYALAQYSLCTGDLRGLEYAARTFDLLQRYAADNARGGYYENLEPDWTLAPGGWCAGDRKSLDIHMHLLECFTTLYQASQLEIHRRRLEEVIHVIQTRMIDPEHGCGRNQFDLDFHPIPPIAIRRTWNAERKGKLAQDVPDTTSYGHNLELGWLLLNASDAMGMPRDTYAPTIRRLAEHALQHGIDWQRGGVFRDGLPGGPVVMRDKEWWQQSESLVGLIDAYRLFGDSCYLQAFELTWDFAKQYFIHPQLGEWRTLVREDGTPIDNGLGNPWKACYHTGRAMSEVLKRIDRAEA